MKAVFTHFDSARVGLCKSLLDEAGIACFVRNDASGNLTSIPVPVFYPVLCVINDADLDRAQQLLQSQGEAVSSTGSDWICPHCQSVVPAGFDKCWNCEQDRKSEE
jgi:hypothetical protein